MNQKYDITGMGCAVCSSRIQTGVSQMEGIKQCDVNLLTNSMEVSYDESKLSSQDIIQKVEALGYGASLKDDGSEETDEDSEDAADPAEAERNRLKKRLIISASLAIPLFFFCAVSSVRNLFLNWAGYVGGMLIEFIMVIALMIVNRHFYKSGFSGLIHRAPNMDTLVSVGTIASFLLGYYDSVGMILTLVTFGKYLESGAKSKTTEALRGLIGLIPETATVIRDGQEMVVKSNVIRKGETILAHPGEAIACDGIVLEGNTHINQSAITGESVPVKVSAGDKVIGGTINIDGYIKYAATDVGKNTVLSGIIRLVEDASSSKAPISRLADKVASVFVPVVMGISLLTVIVWVIATGGTCFPIEDLVSAHGTDRLTIANDGFLAWLLAADWARALNCGISVLVISCPCALGLATPVAIMVGIGRGAKEGIIIKNATALENLGNVNTMVFDKTGTITKGIVLDTVGLEKRLQGDSTILDTGKDEIRPEAFETISRIKAMGITPVLLSGDKKEIACAVSEEVGIDSFYSDVFPNDKEKIIRELQQSDTHPLVAMVGDGVNDAPAITIADIGIAIGTGTDIAIDAADVVLMGDGLETVVKAVSLSRSTIKNIKESLFWAFFYNAICIPVAAGALYPIFGILLNPVICAACMSLSSVTVCLNALRLRNKKIG